MAARRATALTAPQPMARTQSRLGPMATGRKPPRRKWKRSDRMDRMNLKLDIQAGSVGIKKVNLRSSLLVDNLIATIKDKFNLDGEFELRLSNARQPLPPGLELDRAGVSDGAMLVVTRIMESTGTLDAIRLGTRTRLSKNFKRVYLEELRALAEYDLAWQPAVIGRKDHRDPSKNKLLAVDLGDMEEATSISRH